LYPKLGRAYRVQVIKWENKTLRATSSIFYCLAEMKHTRLLQSLPSPWCKNWGVLPVPKFDSSREHRVKKLLDADIHRTISTSGSDRSSQMEKIQWAFPPFQRQRVLVLNWKTRVKRKLSTVSRRVHLGWILNCRKDILVALALILRQCCLRGL